ncbi:hypothetical protein K0A11_21405 [Salmonella enterica subsp. enterica serovar Mbandaka]|nr:VRR-NUC domain-containing protein [Salmonella enterica]MCR3254761.1 hypothetical protein [Salmonella enterica subsp. enterica serovar Mbandaka]MCR3282332.1 hypothetical protein [Salmonella enterica subsp. enterica serovar Mbandaka]MCR3316817.1 hypothetical protein [Salmonella enterica subsp. enterica serovar Mbandaka]
MAKTPEGEIVAYGRKRLTEKGCLVRKIAYEMRRGCPDHLVLVPVRPDEGYGLTLASKIMFIEYKATEDTRPEEHQLREHARMRAAGADVRVIGSKRQVDELIGELFPCK